LNWLRFLTSFGMTVFYENKRFLAAFGMTDVVRNLLNIVVFCMTITGGATAQNDDTLFYRSQSVRSVGFGFPVLNYPFLSELNHSGYSFSFHSTRFRDKPDHLTQFHQHFELGILYNNANDSYITKLGFAGGWSRHWRVTDPTQPLRLFVGAGADMGVSIYLKDDNTNNPIAYFFNISLSPSILLKYRFNINETKIELGQQVDIPLGSLISSSSYSSGLPYAFTEEEASFFDAMRLVSFGSLRKFATITTLDITPSPERRQKMPVFRISYMFAGMNYSNGDFTIKSVDHLFLFGMIFHLFR